MASHPYYVPNPYPNLNSQNYQQPMVNGMYSIPPFAIANIPPNVYPLPQQQQQQQYHAIYQQQQQQYNPIYQQQQQQQYGPLYQQQQQRQYQPTTNTFPFDAILFYDDYKPYYEFTNFAKIGFDLDGHYWPTSEHYFQAQKFKDHSSIQYKIRNLPGARDAFEYAREPNNKSLVRKDWAEKKEEIMYKALRAKFSQNNSLRDKLLQTNDRMLVEDSPYDPYWGIGSDKNGKNRLGELLMKLRTELRNTITTTSHTSSVTQLTLKRSSSLSRLTTPSFPTITDDEIIYEVNDATHFLANCYPASFKLEGKDWPTVLHYFVAKKFDLRRHHVSKIQSMKDCQEVHLYSRNLRFQSDIVTYWDTDKKKVMKQGLKAKFEQNPLLKDKLLNTGGSEIIERSTNDMYWSQLANGSGRNLMGQLLCEVRSELNKHPSTPPNSSLSKWKSFENIPSSPKTPDHTSPHSSSKRLSQPIHSPSYKLVTDLSSNLSERLSQPITVNDLSSNLSRNDIYSSKNPKTSNTFHFTDFVDTGVYHEFSTYSRHSFNLDGEYWKSVQHYFQAQKYPSTKWLVTDIRTALTSKRAYEIGKDKVYSKNIVKNWDSIREGVMLKALKAKFRNHDRSKDILLVTGDIQIVNDSKNEFWGCGKDGKGKNTLGMLLMIVRTECLNTSTKPSLQPNNTNTYYSHPSSPLKAAPNNDVIEFYDKDKPYFEFTPYSEHTVCLDGFLWKTLNHYFQAQKFTSNNEKRKIADARTPDRATYIAYTELKKFSKFQTFNEKEVIMKKGLEAKFTQHPDLRRMLLDTGTKKLLFMHPEDSLWGTGTTQSLRQNKLGVLLTELRQKLRIPTASSTPIYNPVNIQHTDSHPYSSSDDNTTQQRIIKGYDSYTNKRYSFPPKQVTSQRRPYFSILMILVLIITVLIRCFGI